MTVETPRCAVPMIERRGPRGGGADAGGGAAWVIAVSLRAKLESTSMSGTNAWQTSVSRAGQRVRAVWYRVWRRLSRRGRAALVAGVLAAGAVLFAGGGAHHRVGGHDALIARHARATGLDEALVRSVVTHESGGDARAVSPAAARGLMQITAITERDVLQRNPGLQAGDLFHPDYNVKVGTTYLAYLLKRFDGDRTLAVAAYHMGPTAIRRAMNADPDLPSLDLVQKHGGPQTRAYTAKVLRDAH